VKAGIVFSVSRCSDVCYHSNKPSEKMVTIVVLKHLQ